MYVVRIVIKNFRCIREACIFPQRQNVLLGPNNSGKTAILEALNLLLNPEISLRSHSIDENDFFQRVYVSPPAASDSQQAAADPALANEISDLPAVDPPILENPKIYIEVVISGFSQGDANRFHDTLVPWDEANKSVVEQSDQQGDPFNGRQKAIRAFFEGWYSSEEDDFLYHTKFLREQTIPHDECPPFSREDKRHIGFLIYRDFRALTRPITLEQGNLFATLLQSQGAKKWLGVIHFKNRPGNVLGPVIAPMRQN